jgi:hypothetical protein
MGNVCIILKNLSKIQIKSKLTISSQKESELEITDSVETIGTWLCARDPTDRVYCPQT